MTKLFPVPPGITKWFREEQSRFLTVARCRAGLRVEAVTERTGIDIQAVEACQADLVLRDLFILIKLYRAYDGTFVAWVSELGRKIRQMLAE